MSRLAFISSPLEDAGLTARLGVRFANSEVDAEIDLKWKRPAIGVKWERPVIICAPSPAELKEYASLLVKLDEVMSEDREEGDKVTWRKPADVIKVIMENKGIHTVFDERVERYVDAAKLTRAEGDTEKLYAATIGGKDFHANSLTEKGAQSAILKQVTEAAAVPGDEGDAIAAEMGSWIRKGKIVKEHTIEGEPPTVVPINVYLDDPNGKIEIKHRTRKSGEHAVA